MVECGRKRFLPVMGMSSNVLGIMGVVDEAICWVIGLFWTCSGERQLNALVRIKRETHNGFEGISHWIHNRIEKKKLKRNSITIQPTSFLLRVKEGSKAKSLNSINTQRTREKSGAFREKRKKGKTEAETTK